MTSPSDQPPIDPDAIAQIQAAVMWPCPAWCVSSHDHDPPEVRTHRSQARQIGSSTGVLVLLLQTDYGNGMLHPPHVDVFDRTRQAPDGTFPSTQFSLAEAVIMADVLNKLDGVRPTLHGELAAALRAAAALAAEQKGDQ
ncbi:hypothetical protein ACWDRB_63395 [Nonomuraea sp. NPDC003707]